MNFLLKNTLLVFALLFAGQMNAQDETLFEKIDVKLTGAWGGPHTIFSGFQDDNSFSNGGFGGVEFNKIIYLGWGSYNMQTKLKFDDGTPNKDYELNYNGPHVSYSLRPSMVVHPTVSIMAGPGTTKVDGVKDDNIFVFQPSAGVEFNLFKWFRINIRGGVRSVFDADANAQVSNDDLSSFFGGIDFKFGYSWGSDDDEVKEDKMN